MLSTLDSTLKPTTESRHNVMLNFIDTKGKYRTRNYDVFEKAHREKILKTIEWALIHKIEIRIRSI